MDEFNSTSGAAPGTLDIQHRADVSPALKKIFAERTHLSLQLMEIYTGVLCCFAGIRLVVYWCRAASRRRQRPATTNPFVSFCRAIKRVGIRKIPGFTSVGEAAVLLIFIALNVVFSFVGVKNDALTNYGARFGWMAIFNLIFTIFLSVKNTPLTLIGYSHDQLNRLHQFAGWSVALHTVLHGALYSAYFVQTGKTGLLANKFQIAGSIAGMAIVLIAATTLLRSKKYETFYVIHVSFFLLAAATAIVHQPKNVLIPGVVTLGIWGLDRAIRLGKLGRWALNNSVTLQPLPDGGTQLLFNKKSARIASGMHCFVWIPEIRTFETHPFTVLDARRMEFVVKSYGGFSKALHQYAVRNPGVCLAASIDGPYGEIPDVAGGAYDKLVLICGGTGATFCYALAQNFIESQSAEKSNKELEFIWVVTDYDKFAWFSAYLANLRAYQAPPSVRVHLYVSRARPQLPPATSVTPVTPDTPSMPSMPSMPDTPDTLETPDTSVTPVTSDTPAAPVLSDSSLRTIPFTPGRPDVRQHMESIVNSTPNDQRILVAVCGPQGLTHDTRSAVAATLRGSGPAVDIHCEEFGW